MQSELALHTISLKITLTSRLLLRLEFYFVKKPTQTIITTPLRASFNTTKSRRTVRTTFVQIFRPESIDMIDLEVDSMVIKFCKAKFEQPLNTNDKPELKLILNKPNHNNLLQHY